MGQTGYLWTGPRILHQVQILSLKPLYGKKKKIISFIKTIAAYDLKVGRGIELNDLMNLHEYQRSRSFFDLCQRLLGFQT